MAFYNTYQQYNPYGYAPVSPQNGAGSVLPQQSQIIRVNGKNGAEAFRMAPNSSILLMDENGKTITNSASRKKKEAIDKAVSGASTKQKHLLYEALGVSEKVW